METKFIRLISHESLVSKLLELPGSISIQALKNLYPVLCR